MTENFTVNLTGSQVEMLKNLLDSFESGYIANPAKWAERERVKYEKLIRSMVAQLP